ncbi:MAG TPA: alpha-L-rhamnosidase C-terminal domain-containing protein, partial [Rariglobus sp.]
DAPRPYENQSDLGLPVTGPAVVTGRLPANLQLYPRFRARAAAGGMEIAVHIERDKKTTRYLTRAGEQEFEVPAWGNGHDVTYTLPAGVELLEITYRETGYASEISGLFSSSDAALDRLWGKAARTARLCLRDTFMDCPDRERSPWIGDAANILEVTLRALDRRSDALIVKTLDELAGWAAPGGNLWSAVPTSRFAGGFREFPAQILPMLGFGLPAYLAHTDDRSFLPSFYPAMRRYLLELFQTGDGIVRHRGPWTVGWEPGVQCWYDWEENIDAELLDQLLYFAALDGLRQCALALGLAEDVLLCDELRRSQRKAFDAAYWSDTLAAYRSPRHGDAPPDERAQALAILTGLAPGERHPQLADRIEESERCSIYMERYPLLALAHAGRPQSALRRLKRRFAAEIDSDYSTLPERFGERSNHAWGGAAIVLLAEKLTGVTLLESGFRKVRFAPPPDGLAAADWTIPSLLGKLRLAFRREETGTRYQLSVPAGIVVELDTAACLDRIAVNGSRLDRDARGRCQGLRVIEQTGNPVRLLVGSGAWIFFVEQG